MPNWSHYVRQNLTLRCPSASDEAAAIEEIASQLEDVYREALQQGLSEDEAAQEAKRHIGDWDKLSRELAANARYRPIRPALKGNDRQHCGLADVLDWLIRDVRYAARRLRRSAAFTLVAMLTLGLGIGGNTVIFSAINSLLLHPVGIKDARRVLASVLLTKNSMSRARLFRSPSFLMYATVRMYLPRRRSGIWSATTTPGRICRNLLSARRVTWQWFDVFGAKPVLGRLFTPEEDQPNSNRVVILDYRTWQSVCRYD